MVFNTGAALLDAVVLAVVSREQEGTYGYKITQDVREVLGDLRRMAAWKFMISNTAVGTADIIRSHLWE